MAVPGQHLTPERKAALIERLREPGAVPTHIARDLGISPTTVRDWAARLKAEAGDLGANPVLPGFRLSRSSVEQDEAGRTTRRWIEQKPARGEPFAVPEGHTVKGVSALVDESGREVAKWIKTREADSDPLAMVAALREAMEDLRGSAPVAAPAPDLDDDLLTVYTLPDLHLGMMAWGRETGESYDLKIAAELAQEGIARLVSQAPPARHAILLGLGDYFHQNDAKNMTPRSGHVLDVDGRWRKVYSVGSRVALNLSEQVSRKHNDVEVVFLPGNHDPDAAITLSVALGLYYDGHERIKVSDAPGLLWYRRFGSVLLGATHGHTMKPERMALTLAADRAEDWGASRFRHFFFGHVHHESAKEVGAVRVESFSSPAAKDAHAHGGGWRSGRALTAVTFHRARGEVFRHRVNIEAQA